LTLVQLHLFQDFLFNPDKSHSRDASSTKTLLGNIARGAIRLFGGEVVGQPKGRGANQKGCADPGDDLRLISRSLAWGLLQGDMTQKLEELKNSPEAQEPTLQKIWKLLHMGFNRNQLALGLELLGDCSWSTTSVEQQHGSASTIMKLHGEYSRETMMSRSIVHAMRQFFQPPVEEQQLAPLERKVEALEGKKKKFAYFAAGSST
jgi:hypothetical protein